MTPRSAATRWLAALCACGAWVSCGDGVQEITSTPRFALDAEAGSPGYGTIVIGGLSSRELAGLVGLSNDAWASRFPVFTAEASTVADRPPIAGEYFIEDEAVRFVPDFALLPGTTYVARCIDVAGRVRAEARLTLPPPALAPTTSVRAVYPTADVVPENLLKLYVEFTAPMSRGEAARRVRLDDLAGATGGSVPLPWVAPEHELWNATVDRLTLFFDPGRIKQGVGPNLEHGPPLVAGREYRLIVDAGWLDATGQPLVTSFEKTFRVAAPDRESPRPTAWVLGVPDAAAGARDPLTLAFGEPLDRALAERMIRVVDAHDRAVAGTVRVGVGETEWRFTPRDPWRPARYAVVVDSAVEDLAGNSPRRRFDEPMAAPRADPAPIHLAFAITD